jgi:glutaredoxin
MKITIWSKLNCPACERAKALCELTDIEFEVLTVGVDKTREQLLEAVPNARSVPQIFVDGSHVGGYQDLVDHLDKL